MHAWKLLIEAQLRSYSYQFIHYCLNNELDLVTQ